MLRGQPMDTTRMSRCRPRLILSPARPLAMSLQSLRQELDNVINPESIACSCIKGPRECAANARWHDKLQLSSQGCTGDGVWKCFLKLCGLGLAASHFIDWQLHAFWLLSMSWPHRISHSPASAASARGLLAILVQLGRLESPAGDSKRTAFALHLMI